MGAIYIGKKLGSGGFEKDVVLKQLLPEYTARPEFRDLFFREARISATLDHANIVHTFDLVESDQSLFIVMEYVRGADLRTIVRRARQRRRDLSPAAAVHIALEILSGLSYAHTRRDSAGKSLDIIHRDVSPSNIICSAQGEAKLSDFGIAKASTHSSVFYRVRGKVGYMSPEQARNQQIDHRCDLFSLAVCLYESLSGERLFVGDLTTPADEIYGHAVMPLSEKRSGIPRALDTVLARALAPALGSRYETAIEFSDALRTAAHQTGLTFSAPELAAHLCEILGADVSRWLRDEPTSGVNAETQKIPAASIGLVGKEAASIGIVDEPPEDEAPLAVLSPIAVSGSKDFDIDSMLSDEATRPGGPLPVPGNGARKLESGSDAATPDHSRRTAPPAARAAQTPPPVWTRDSGPLAVGAAHDAKTEPRASAPPPPARPIPAPKRPLPRATQRQVAVPPPFVAPPRASGAVAVPHLPPPPPMPPANQAFGASGDDALTPPPLSSEFEDATPLPGFSVLGNMAPTYDVGDMLTPPPPLTSHDGGSLISHGYPGIPMGAPASRGMPPQGYPGVPSPSAPPPILSQPPTMDFSGAVSAFLPEQKGGPPSWLVLSALLVSLVGGAVLAHRVTSRDVAQLASAETKEAKATTKSKAREKPAAEARPDEDPVPAPESEKIKAARPEPKSPESAPTAAAAPPPAVRAAPASKPASRTGPRRGGPISKKKHHR